MRRRRAASTGRLSYFFYRAFAVALAPVPRRVAHLVGEIAGRVVSHVASGQRTIVESNLRRVVGDLPEKEMRRLVAKSFASYGKYWADVAKLGPSAERHVDRWFRTEGDEALSAIAERNGAGVLFVLPHVGSWEMGGVWAKSQGMQLVTVAEDAASDQLFQWFAKRRERLGLRILPIAATTATSLLEELRDGGAVALLADRDVVGDGIEVSFFGASARIPAGPALLALRSGALLIPSVVYQVDGHYRAVFSAPLDTTRKGHLREDVYRVSEDLLRNFESAIRVAPEQWHVFQPIWPAENELH